MAKTIDDEILKNVCKMGQGNKCCRYISCGANGFECEKHTALKKVFDAKVQTGRFVAQGDNCEGLK